MDVLFHDTDGTTSLKVVSLEDSTAYITGKVAIVTGTCGTTNVTVATSPSTFRDASGAISVTIEVVYGHAWCAPASKLERGTARIEFVRPAR